MRQGAIILCGGKSTRMGRDKATLPFGNELMLQRVVRLVGEVVPPPATVVVASPRQSLPELPQELLVARDERDGCGPLEGLAAGLRTLRDQVDAAYVTACDVPLLKPAFVGRMFDLLGDHDIAVPLDGRQRHPLAAVYRMGLLPHIEQLLKTDQLSLRTLFSRVRTREVPVALLRAVDPQLDTLKNLNERQDYLAALAAADFPPETE
jgi:molybdopterin-guanine dinucleotide biosynthesis protein A